mmetsp:Transcript_39605/g.123354  ORF Transcript_39605/g.123354 Transcript_39605/m.123354 type:complete len:229 (+) Transcript_39605:843-1529(+)
MALRPRPISRMLRTDLERAQAVLGRVRSQTTRRLRRHALRPVPRRPLDGGACAGERWRVRVRRQAALGAELARLLDQLHQRLLAQRTRQALDALPRRLRARGPNQREAPQSDVGDEVLAKDAHLPLPPQARMEEPPVKLFGCRCRHTAGTDDGPGLGRTAPTAAAPCVLRRRLCAAPSSLSVEGGAPGSLDALRGGGCQDLRLVLQLPRSGVQGGPLFRRPEEGPALF